MKRTATQNKRLYGIFQKLNIDSETKSDLVSQFTNGRTEKSSEMLYNECQNLIETLEIRYRESKSIKAATFQYNSAEQVIRRELFKLMYDVGFIDNGMNTDRKTFIMNGWIRKKMNLEKTLNDLDITELQRMRTQLLTVRRLYLERAAKVAQLN